MVPHQEKGDIHVQDCIHRPPALQHPVRPRDGFDRPPADRQQPHRHPQWRPPPLRSLSLENKRFAIEGLSRRTALRMISLQKWPRFPGPFFVCSGPPTFTNICDKSARTPIRRNNRLPPGISHTNIHQGRSHRKEGRIFGGMKVVQSTRTAKAIWREAGGASHLPSSALYKYTIGRKERMPHQKVPLTIRACNHRTGTTVAVSLS
jgi:hypothetical protein